MQSRKFLEFCAQMRPMWRHQVSGFSNLTRRGVEFDPHRPYQRNLLLQAILCGPPCCTASVYRVHQPRRVSVLPTIFLGVLLRLRLLTCNRATTCIRDCVSRNLRVSIGNRLYNFSIEHYRSAGEDNFRPQVHCDGLWHRCGRTTFCAVDVWSNLGLQRMSRSR